MIALRPLGLVTVLLAINGCAPGRGVSGTNAGSDGAVGAATGQGGAAGGSGVDAGGAGGNGLGTAGGAGSASGGTSGTAGSGGTSGTAGSGGTTIHDVYITWYGFNDNSCQVETQHSCNTIAFPKSDGFPTVHDIATEGKGTYSDPITFATAADDAGNNAEIPVGALIYVPHVRKYFVMEDQCYECGQEWAAQHAWHVDLWMGPSYGSDNTALMDCEDKLTLGSTYNGTGTIIVDPPANLPVDQTPLFTNDTCTAVTY